MTLLFSPKDKLLHHLDALARFEKGDIDAPPVNVEIAPTNFCNAKCDWCFYVSGEYKQKHTKEWLDKAVLEQTLREFAEMGIKAVTWTGGGDPSIYPGIDRMIDVAYELGLHQGMFTNGYRKINHPEKLDWIRLTVTERFTVPDTAAEYAHATKTGVNFNLTNDNEKHLEAMVRQARAAGVAYFQVRPALADRPELQERVNWPLWLLDYQTDAFKVVLTPYKFEDYAQPHGYPICHGHRLVPFVWHDGRVDVCAYHFKTPELYSFGNLYQETFRQIWHGERRRELLEVGIPVIPQCQHCCKNHEVNKVMAAIAGDVTSVADREFV